MKIRTLSVLLVFQIACYCSQVSAGSATWSANPTSSDWDTATNWTPNTIPNGTTDVASFLTSSIFDVTLGSSSVTTLDSLIFNGSQEFNVTVAKQASLLFVGGGLVNNFPSALSRLTLEAGGAVTFQNQSSCNVLFENYGTLRFEDRSSMSYVLSCYGDASGGQHGSVVTFADQSRVTGDISVSADTDAGAQATVFFRDDSIADTSLLAIYSGGIVDISGHHSPGLTVYSLLSSHTSTVLLGHNNLSVTSGDIFDPQDVEGVRLADGGKSGGHGGTFTKIGGAGSIVILTGDSSYTGGTFVEGGTLYILSSYSHKPVGFGDVHIDKGTFAGSGRIIGHVFVGTDSGVPARVMAGGLITGVTFGDGNLIIKGGITLASDGVYETGINTKTGHANEIISEGISITEGAQIKIVAAGDDSLASGSVFTLINNTAETAISGTFSNLPDGGTIAIGENNCQASYEGGDGNDLTLTVLP